MVTMLRKRFNPAPEGSANIKTAAGKRDSQTLGMPGFLALLMG